jgi:uncharacterized protein (TIGR04255 family)
MAKQRLLRKPPIVEALIDIRFNVPETTKLADLRAVCEFFVAEFPSFEERNTGSAKIELRGAEGIKIESTPPEISHFVRTNGTASSLATRSIAIQRDGITVSHANNYGGWDELIALTYRLFEQFVQVANPIATIRLGARYINKIELPHTSFDLDHYFVCGPKIPPSVPQTVFEFYHRTGIVAEPPSLKAWVNQYLVKIGAEISPSVILDIDVFQSERYAPIWNDIAQPSEKIHDLKNRLFFGSLTDLALDAYT